MTWQKVALFLAGAWVAVTASKPALSYFSADEFGIWFPVVDDELLVKLDDLRARWGYPIHVSPVGGAVGRADASDSQHNIIHNLGHVRAVDVFPEGASGAGMNLQEASAFIELVSEVGFSGYGIYLDTVYQGQPWIMAHLDVRADRSADNPATWSRIAGQYRPLFEALT